MEEFFSVTEIDKLKNYFLVGAAIDNPSGGEEKIAEWCAAELKKLGVESEIDAAKNLFAKIPGEKKEPVFLAAHLDSVQPCCGKKIIFDGEKFFSDGHTILGADDVAGIAAIFAAIAFLKKRKIPHRPLEILLTAKEEVGGSGIKKFDFQKLTAKNGIVADSMFSVGTIVQRSPAKNNFSIAVRGRAAHSGQVSAGTSAIKILADLISLLPNGKISENIFFNIGKISGGTAVNSVPAAAEISGEISAFCDGEIRADEKNCKLTINLISEKIKKIEKKYPAGKIFFSHSMVRNSYFFSPENPAILAAKKAISAAGLQPILRESAGASDANTLNSAGKNAVLLGIGVECSHSVDEKIKFSELKKLAEILVHFCKI